MQNRKSENKDNLFRGDYGVSAPLDVKMLTEDGQFEGFGSTFGDVDNGNDIVMPGAFADSLVKWPAGKVKMLFQHRSSDIIGKWLEMRETDKGLYVKGQLFLDIKQAADVHKMMVEGQLDGLSIGFRTKKYEYDTTLGVRRLLKVDLREVSVVTFPMNETATVTLVKSDRLPTEREFEQYLARDAGFTVQQAKAIIANGYKSLLGARDAGQGDHDSGDWMFRLAAAMRGEQ